MIDELILLLQPLLPTALTYLVKDALTELVGERSELEPLTFAATAFTFKFVAK